MHQPILRRTSILSIPDKETSIFSRRQGGTLLSTKVAKWRDSGSMGGRHVRYSHVTSRKRLDPFDAPSSTCYSQVP